MYCFIRSLSTCLRRLHHTCTITEMQKRKRKRKQNKLTRTVKPVNVSTEIWELGSNFLLISRDFKNCMVIRALYFKVFALANR